VRVVVLGILATLAVAAVVVEADDAVLAGALDQPAHGGMAVIRSPVSTGSGSSGAVHAGWVLGRRRPQKALDAQ